MKSFHNTFTNLQWTPQQLWNSHSHRPATSSLALALPKMSHLFREGTLIRSPWCHQKPPGAAFSALKSERFHIPLCCKKYQHSVSSCRCCPRWKDTSVVQEKQFSHFQILSNLCLTAHTRQEIMYNEDAEPQTTPRNIRTGPMSLTISPHPHKPSSFYAGLWKEKCMQTSKMCFNRQVRGLRPSALLCLFLPELWAHAALIQKWDFACVLTPWSLSQSTWTLW